MAPSSPATTKMGLRRSQRHLGWSLDEGGMILGGDMTTVYGQGIGDDWDITESNGQYHCLQNPQKGGEETTAPIRWSSREGHVDFG